MTFSKVSVRVIAAVALAIALVAAGILLTTKNYSRPIACTMEALQCPDGSYVGRTGPNCQFAACPSQIPSPQPTSLDCNGLGDSCPSGYTCIQKCGPPVVRAGDPPPGYYCELNEVASKPRMCPICLASNTRIATPIGEVNVKDVTVGMRVWSINGRGAKVASAVAKASRASAPSTHKVVHLVLTDGREVWVSPSHPTAGGRPVGSLRAGDGFDGAVVLSTDLVQYWDNETYDLLPNSVTGTYWANGILLGSTLLGSN